MESSSDSLKSKAITASLWAIIERFSVTISQFVVGIILARLLEPSDFGIIALTTIFVATLNVITDGGFESIIIQAKVLSGLQINTVFYINIIIGLIMGATQYLLAPAIAHFFNEPRLVEVLRYLSLIMPLEALGQTQRTLLMKELRFRKLSIYQIISSLVSGAVGIILAYYGFGVLALVYSTLTALSVRVLLLWIRSDWYPSFQFSYRSVSRLVPSGINVMITSLIFFFMQEFNSLIIGKFYSERDLGLYNRGLKFPDLVTGVVQSIVLKLSLPLFSSLQDDNERLRNTIERTNTTISIILFPLLLLLFINANEIVILLLTDKWVESIIYFKLFCIVKLFEPYINVYRNVLIAKSKTAISFRVSLLTSGVEVIIILITAKFGLLYIIAAVLFSRLLQYLIYSWIGTKEMVENFSKSVRALAIYVLLSALVLLGVTAFDKLAFQSNHPNLIQHVFINTLLCSVLYFTFWSLLKKRDVLYIRNMLYGYNSKAFGFLKA